MPHVMDRPEICQLLFRPRTVAHTDPPQGAVDLDIRVAPPDGVIGCRLFTADKALPTILCFHGNGEIVTEYDAIGPQYIEVGLNLCVASYRGYGWGSGLPSFSNLVADCHILYAQIRQYLGANGYSPVLVLMGRSLGSASAIELAAAYNSEVAGLIIDSGFALTLPLAEGLAEAPPNLPVAEEETFNNGAKIRQVTRPVLLVHGQRDTRVPLWQAERLHAECGSRIKELLIIPGAGHNALIATAGRQYFLTIKRFINQVTGADDWRQRRRALKAAQQGG